MARQTSKNRWVHGKVKLAYQPNGSEFAGGREMGEAVPLGTFTLNRDGKDTQLSVYDGHEKRSVIDTFLRTGSFDE